MDKKMHTYEVELEILTPLIINTGEYYQFGELLPTEDKATIKDRDENLPLPKIFKFYVNNMVNLFDGMDPASIRRFVDKSTVALAKRDNDELKKLRNMLVEKTGTKGKMPIRVLGKAKRDLFAKPDQQVSKIAFSPLTNQTYVPGSSIKGAIRTGVLEELRKRESLDYWGVLTDDSIPSYRKPDVPKQKIRDAQDFEMEVMKGRKQKFEILQDPFKYLKVSDFAFSGIDAITYIAKVGDDEKMPIYSAMTNSYAFSGKPVVARGTITIDDRFYREIRFGGISSFDKVLELTGDFYLDNINTEKVRNEITSDLMRYIFSKKLEEKLQSGAFLMRFGHYTGIQNYTFKVNQKNPPKTHPSPDINITGGRIVKLEEGILPGICTIRITREI